MLRRYLPRAIHRLLILFTVGSLLLPTSLYAVQQNLAEGQAAYQRGDFVTALQIFKGLMVEYSGDPEFDFLLGRSAFESGDFETAVFAFERVLIIDPEADRVRLEMARAFYELGDLQSARSNFQQVLAKQPPLGVQRNIARFLALVEQAERKHLFGGNLSLGLSYDTNVYSSPAEEQIVLLGGDIVRSERIQVEKEDWISRTSLLFSHLYRPSPNGSRWFSTLLLHNASYFDETELNLMLAGLTTGPAWQQGTTQGKLQALGNYLTLDGDHYLTIGGLSLEQSWPLGRSLNLRLFSQAAYLDFAEDARDGMQYRLSGSSFFALGKNRFTLELGGETLQAREDVETYLRGTFGLTYQRLLPWQLLVGLGGRLQYSDYDGSEPQFGKSREDTLGEVSLSFSRPLWRGSAGGQLLMQLAGTYTDTNSSIELYDYTKQVVNLALNYQF